MKTPLEADLYDLGPTSSSILWPLAIVARSPTTRAALRYARTHLGSRFSAKFQCHAVAFCARVLPVMKVASSTVSCMWMLPITESDYPSGEYNIRLHGEDLAAMSAPVKPVGDVSLTGNIHYQNENIDRFNEAFVVKR